MSTLEFLASIVDSIAWPAAVLVVIVVFRRPLRAMLAGDIKRWKAGPSGLEVEYWNSRLEAARLELETESPQLELKTADESVPGDGGLEDLRELAALSPRSAVLESFVRIERALSEVLDSAQSPPPPGPSGGLRLARYAGALKLISPATVDSVEGMSVLRNLAAHGADENLDSKRALEYVDLAEATLYAMAHPPR